ncbi:MAG: asparagine synthase (glutamine-hydrolyzing) [Patescibacteria group bacterium]|jgi:asparagine synthase (glutamine-hydrolysing)
MCGIAGYLKFNNSTDFDQEHLAKMLKTIEYRGPNDQGIFIDKKIGLGHRRLSILDLSSAGHQPMFDSEKSLAIIYNGEVFNYLEIREELKNKGYKFQTETDTEVIIYSYKEWGQDCVKRFNGMWSFVIWDKQKEELFASRDRFGIKPFFYQKTDDYFIFGSEIKTILAVSPLPKKINYKQLYNFIDRNMSYGCSETIFENINELPPGHSLKITGNKMTFDQYWQLDLEKIKTKYDYTKPEKTFRELLIDAVKLRLRSDVPVGVCLSGGIDSTVITGIITKILGQKIDTFSSVYDQPDYNEKKFIEIANNYYGTTAHYLKPDPNKLFEITEKIVKHHDLPVRMPSTFSHWHVMECAAQKVIVTLDGQGADEILGGYPAYYPFYLADLLRGLKLKKFVQTRKEIKHYLNQSYDKEVIKILTPKFILKIKRLFKPQRRWQDQILSGEMLKFKSGPNKIPKFFSGYLNQALFEAFSTTNLPVLLSNEDRISMAFSLEARVPFLDYRLVEFCFGLPIKYKIDGYRNKVILREAFKDILPPEIYDRKDKKGFPTPNDHWFKNELKNKLQELFYSPNFNQNGLLDTKKVQNIFQQHLSGKNHGRLLWRILTLEIWLKKYFT